MKNPKEYIFSKLIPMKVSEKDYEPDRWTIWVTSLFEEGNRYVQHIPIISILRWKGTEFSDLLRGWMRVPTEDAVVLADQLIMAGEERFENIVKVVPSKAFQGTGEQYVYLWDWLRNWELGPPKAIEDFVE